MVRSYLTDYTEDIKELSAAFEDLIQNSKVVSSAKPKVFYSTGHGIIADNFYVGNNLTVGLSSIEVKNAESCILSIPNEGEYSVSISNEKSVKFSKESGGIVLPSDVVLYEAISDRIEDLIIIIDKVKLRSVFKRNYNYDFDKIEAKLIHLLMNDSKVSSVVNFIKSTLETAKNFPHLRESLLVKSNIEEITALYISDLIAHSLNISFNHINAPADLNLVIAAEKLIEKAPEKFSTVLEIADKTLTSPRNLQLAFKKHRSYSPMNFLKERKIHLARKLLLNASSNETIKNIAITSGIVDVNRFGKHYYSYFNELPSETLKNRVVT